MSSLNNRRSKPDIKVEVMAKVDMAATTSTTMITTTTTTTTATSPNRTNNSSPEGSIKNGKKKRFIPRIFGSKRNGRGSSDEDSLKSDGDNGFDIDLDQKILSRRKELMETAPFRRKTFSERSETSSNIESLNLSNFEHNMTPANEIKEFRIFVATWNVGGRAPDNDLNLEDFLQIEGASDIYIIGFQEIVPLSAGNVLGSEDNEPAAKWLVLIDQALNKPHHDAIYLSGNIGSKYSNNSKDSKDSKDSKSHLFHKSNLKLLSKSFRADSNLLKSCNCPVELPISQEKRRLRKLVEPSSNKLQCNLGSPTARRNAEMDEFLAVAEIPSPNQMTYRLIASKQMVGIFLTVWTRKDLVPYIGHLRFSSVGRGIMGCLGNKGCTSISMSVHKTTFCFVCSHLASGEKEGDELRRNSDVAEILKSTQFSKTCKTHPCQRAPEKIIDHDRVIWLGDLNYRVSLSYEETRVLLDDNNWDTLLGKDQLNLEREAGRVFNGFNEGRILFAPTYKYSHNSDSYAGETVKSKKKRRTPAWCDRILWKGEGIEQLSYVRGELRFSDHRPVCAVFAVEVEVRSRNNRFRKGYSCAAPRLIEYDDCIPQRHSLYDF